MVLNRSVQIHYQQEIFHDESGQTLEQVPQNSCGCPIIVSVQTQAGQGFEYFDLVKDVLLDGTR